MVNDVWWGYHTFPLIVAIASGYVGILVVRLIWVRGRRVGPA